MGQIAGRGGLNQEDRVVVVMKTSDATPDKIYVLSGSF